MARPAWPPPMTIVSILSGIALADELQKWKYRQLAGFSAG
jgi:hypothetical protein